MQQSPFPTPEQFCLEQPLYSRVPIPKDRPHASLDIERFMGSVRTHCVQCGDTSVFQVDGTKSGETFRAFRNPNILVAFAERVEAELGASDRAFGLEFKCASDERHRLYFVFVVCDETIQKVGQFPSAADLVGPAIKRFRPVLSKDLLDGYKRAVGLRAHGIGIGAYVYLRRIIEHLIGEAHTAAASAQQWDKAAYQKGRMVERIKMLRGHLPDFMVDNASVYSILSKGVHELTEPECLEHFPVLTSAIDLILDELLAAKRRQEHEKAATRALQGISQQLGKKPGPK